jgi:hypothetical protein
VEVGQLSPSPSLSLVVSSLFPLFADLEPASSTWIPSPSSSLAHGEAGSGPGAGGSGDGGAWEDGSDPGVGGSDNGGASPLPRARRRTGRLDSAPARAVAWLQIQRQRVCDVGGTAVAGGRAGNGLASWLRNGLIGGLWFFLFF